MLYNIFKVLIFFNHLTFKFGVLFPIIEQFTYSFFIFKASLGWLIEINIQTLFDIFS